MFSQDIPVTTLKQTGLFQLPADPSSINGVASGGGVLWFLLGNGNWNELLAMDAAGGNPNRFAVRPAEKRAYFPVRAMCANPDGNIAVARPGKTAEIYSRLGVLLKEVTIPAEAFHCVYDQDLWVWSRTSLDAVDGPKAGTHFDPPPLPIGFQVELLALPDHRIGLVDSTEAGLYLPDPQHNWQRHALMAPEIQGLNRPAPSEDSVMPYFSGMGATPDEFYVQGNGYKPKIGAKILRFDAQGKLKGRYLCPLPTGLSPHTIANSEGYLGLTNVIVVGRTLLLISWSQKAVASYELN